MKKGDPQIMVSIRMDRTGLAERLKAAEIAFRWAAQAGIDSIKVQPPFIRDPPDPMAQALRKWIKTGKRQRRWVVFERPSVDDLDRALAAAPYVEAVNLFKDGRVSLSVSDAEDNLDLELSGTEWARLRPELESILGGSIRYDTEELAGSG